MLMKRVAAGILAGLLSASLIAGCTGGGGKGDDSKKPAATPSAKVEMKGEPSSTFPFGNKTAKVFALEGPAAKEDFNFTGERIVFANGAIYHHGETSDGKGGDIAGLYKLPLKGNAITGREFVAKSDDGPDHRNLAASRGNVLFQLDEGDKLAIYDGKNITKSDSKWKDDYDAMVGFVEGDGLLLVRSLDTICTAKQELSEIKGVKEVVKDAREVLKLKDAGPMRPVYADANELFVSCQVNADDFTTDLFAFDKNGKPGLRYAGIKEDAADWAVTKNYVVQAGKDGAILIYERKSGKKIYDAKARDLNPSYLCSMGGDMILLYDDWNNKFCVLNLE